MKEKFVLLFCILLFSFAFLSLFLSFNHFAQENLPTPAFEKTLDEENMIIEGEMRYKHMGERDPFSPLIKSGKGGGASGVKVRYGTKGLTQFTLDQCILEAIVKIGNEEVAWFQGPNLKPYKAKVGDSFADGVIIDISYERGEVIVQQEIDDPTMIKPFRNVSVKIRAQSQNIEGEAQ